MAIHSFYFLLFWGAVLVIALICQFIEKKLKKENYVGMKLVLVIASYIFATLYDWKFAVELFIFTLFIYIIGKKIEHGMTKRRKIFLYIGVSISIVFLCVFKYGNSVLDTCERLFGNNSIAFKLIMPLGLSYYVFSAISYLVDIYQKKLEQEYKFIDVVLFLAFFPKMTAGPITKAYEFLPKIESYCGIHKGNIQDGIQIFVFGLFKKVVLADHLAVFVDDVFYAPVAYNTPTIILAVISYSLQIYFDFSGYSDMAIGVAKTLGIDLPCNFNLPYIATDISDFWKRWHISLSSWLQEYVYIPLGGSRKGNVRTYLNLMLVMLISGLWHGNGWTFLTWGMLYGVVNCLHRLSKKLLNDKFKINNVISIFWNFAMVTLLWVFFRAESMRNAFAVLKGIFVYQNGICQMYLWSFIAAICLITSSTAAYIRSKKEKKQRVQGFYPIMNLNTFGSMVLFFVFIGLTIMLGNFGETAFIYGGF